MSCRVRQVVPFVVHDLAAVGRERVHHEPARDAPAVAEIGAVRNDSSRPALDALVRVQNMTITTNSVAATDPRATTNLARIAAYDYGI